MNIYVKIIELDKEMKLKYIFEIDNIFWLLNVSQMLLLFWESKSNTYCTSENKFENSAQTSCQMPVIFYPPITGVTLLPFIPFYVFLPPSHCTITHRYPLLPGDNLVIWSEFPKVSQKDVVLWLIANFT